MAAKTDEYDESRMGIKGFQRKSEEIKFLWRDYIPLMSHVQLEKISASEDQKAEFRAIFAPPAGSAVVSAADPPTSCERSGLLRTCESMTARALGAIPFGFVEKIAEFRRWDLCVADFEFARDNQLMNLKIGSQFLFRSGGGYFCEFPPISTAFSHSGGWTLCSVNVVPESEVPLHQQMDHPLLSKAGKIYKQAHSSQTICEVRFKPDLAARTFNAAFDIIHNFSGAAVSNGVS